MIKDLLETLKESVEKSGFPLEMHIGELLTDNSWNVDHDFYYFDYDENGYRELDVKATKWIEGIHFKLFIACKQSENRQWVFFSPKASPALHTFYLKHLPSVDRSHDGLFNFLDHGKDSLFSKYFKMNDEVALKHVIFKGDKPIEDTDIREALFSASKALFHDNLWNHGITIRTINIPIIIFEGKLFVYSFYKSFAEADSLRYLHFCPISNRQAYKDHPELSRLLEIWHSKYLVEIMNPKVFKDYLDKIELFAKELAKQDLSKWGKPLSLPNIPAVKITEDDLPNE
jgi:hypothetical protein